MKLCVRSFDPAIKDLTALIDFLKVNNIDGVQLVCYKTFEGIAYKPDGITEADALRIGGELKKAGLIVPLIGAYFNPVHSDIQKAERCGQIFRDYINRAADLGGAAVGSETGSYNDDIWSYHPRNRTQEALTAVVETFTGLCDYALTTKCNVAIEGAFGHICWNPDVLNEAYNRINRLNLKIIVDLYNYLDVSNFSGYLEILKRSINLFGDKILLYHIKDGCVIDGKLVRRRIGEGEFNFIDILGEIKQFDKNAVLVLEGTEGGDIAPAAAYLRKIWESV